MEHFLKFRLFIWFGLIVFLIACETSTETATSGSDPESCLTDSGITEDAITFGGCALPEADLSLVYGIPSGTGVITYWSITVLNHDTYGWIIGDNGTTYYELAGDDVDQLLFLTSNDAFADFLQNCSEEEETLTLEEASYKYVVASEIFSVPEAFLYDSLYCTESAQDEALKAFLLEKAEESIPGFSAE